MTEGLVVARKVPKDEARSCEVAFVYLLFCTVLTTLQTYCEKRMKTY